MIYNLVVLRVSRSLNEWRYGVTVNGDLAIEGPMAKGAEAALIELFIVVADKLNRHIVRPWVEEEEDEEEFEEFKGARFHASIRREDRGQ